MRRVILLLCIGLGCLAIFTVADLLVGAPYRANAGRISNLEADLVDMTLRLDEARRRLTLGNAQEPLDVAQLVTPGPNSAAALAALQERVRRTVAAHSGQALSTVGSLSEADDGLSQLTVGLTGRFEEMALFEFLRELEGGTPPIIVEGLTVRPLPVPGGPPLDVSVTLVSFAVNDNAP
jgi:hypothetical protein